MAGERVIKINGVDTEISFIEGLSKVEKTTSLRAKLVPRDEILELGEFLRKRSLEISFTTGVFDMIHIGHARYMQLARSLGDVLVVGLNSDDSVHALKGPDRPILNEERRAEMLSFLSFVDYITIYPESTGAEVIRLLKPNKYLCVEGSWDGDIATKDEVVAIAENGGQVYYTPRQSPTLSTTTIISQISDLVGKEKDEELRMLRQLMENGGQS